MNDRNLSKATCAAILVIFAWWIRAVRGDEPPRAFLRGQPNAAAQSDPSANGILFPPGESIPTAAIIRRGQIGRGPDYRSIVLGTADVFGKGPYDLFLLPNRLLPFLEFDAKGVPVYGAPIQTHGQGMNGAVIAGPGQEILGIFGEGKKIRCCKFERGTLTFRSFAVSADLEIPGEIGVGITGQVNEQGGFDAYFGVSDGVAYRPAGQNVSTSRIPIPFHHSPLYIPYDGAGFWRGGMPRRLLFHARFDSLELKRVERLERAVQGQGEFLFDQFGLAIARLAAGQPRVLISSEHLGNLRCFPLDPMTGAIGEQRLINDQSGVALRHVAITASLRAIPDPQTGLSNFLVGDTARVWMYRPTGKFSPGGSPIFQAAEPVMGQDAPLRLGELAVISPGDIDRDGRTDFMVGNDAGQLLFVRNSGQPGRPEFDNPVAVPVGGKPLNLKAGYRGSIQGPAEAMWGYTCPAVCDWNGDGRLDVVLNSVLADYMVLLQIPSATEVPAFAEPRHLYCDGLQLHLAWRSQPGITDWGQKGKLCMIALDEQNLLRQFWRIDDENVQRGELLRLTDGSTISANIDEAAGQTGRAKLVPGDWDGDGQIDLLIGTSRGLSFPAGKDIYYPSHFWPAHQASVLLLRNAGSNEKPVFEAVRLLQFRGKPIALGIHCCSPHAIDFGTGMADLYVSEENGTIRYYPRSAVSISTPAQ